MEHICKRTRDRAMNTDKAKEYLNKILPKGTKAIQVDSVPGLMTEYVQQEADKAYTKAWVDAMSNIEKEAIGFAEWVGNNGWFKLDQGYWKPKDPTSRAFAIEELYKLYQDEVKGLRP